MTVRFHWTPALQEVPFEFNSLHVSDCLSVHEVRWSSSKKSDKPRFLKKSLVGSGEPKMS